MSKAFRYGKAHFGLQPTGFLLRADIAVGGNSPYPDRGRAIFHAEIPLGAAEMRTNAANEAP